MKQCIKVVADVISTEDCETLIELYQRYQWMESLSKDAQECSVIYTADAYRIPGFSPDDYALFLRTKFALHDLAKDLWNPLPIYMESSNVNTFTRGSGMGVHSDNEEPYFCGEDPDFPHLKNVELWRHNHSPWREFFCILYLNDNFTGGETIIPAFGIKMEPKQGTVILSPGNRHFGHGVNTVKQGTRYAFAQWFTTEASQQEAYEPRKDYPKLEEE